MTDLVAVLSGGIVRDASLSRFKKKKKKKLESAVLLGVGEVLGTSYGKAWRKVQGMRKEEF